MRPSTVSRGVSSGRLPANRLPTGELQIDAAVLDEFLSRRTAAPRAAPADAAIALAAAQERIRGLEALVEEQKGWLRESDLRLQLVLKALPAAASPRRRWWARFLAR